MEHRQPFSRLKLRMPSVKRSSSNHPILRRCPSMKRVVIRGKFDVMQSVGQSGAWKSAFVQVYSSTLIDQRTGIGKLSQKAYFRHGKTKEYDGIKTTTYRIRLRVGRKFGVPGAFLITNQDKHKFYLESATFEVAKNQMIHFSCNSWVYPFRKTISARLFFSNTSYLPSQTPSALAELRKSELLSLRGDGTGEMNEWDRIYDYDYYNDLGYPEKGKEFTRLILGGSRIQPYPRRVRTGRPPSHTVLCSLLDNLNMDPSAQRQLETISLGVYVPSDEQFSPKKLLEVISNSIHAMAHFLVHESESIFGEGSNSFMSFDEIHDIFSRKRDYVDEKNITEKVKKYIPDKLLQLVMHRRKEDTMKFPIPQIIKENKLAWRDDEEFGRQMLAGINAAHIKVLQEFPPAGRYGLSAIKMSDIERNLEGLTVYEAMGQWRIFVLDHHDYLMPFLRKINKEGVCTYASRTLLFLKGDATLCPVAIELSLLGPLKGQKYSRVFLPASQGTEAALWQFAKAHVAANDSVYHQLISHWLHTHAVVEPFIIATRRQLSAMHPIHRLLDPHFKDTMHINALARSTLINCGGIFEKILFSGEMSMQLSSEMYKEWRFDEQALPADLVKRRMAIEDRDNANNPTGVQLLFEDYPYGADGLEIWVAIKAWITDFCRVFYKDDESVKSDIELQAWWSEIRIVGHGDKSKERWWYAIDSISNLVEALTTLIWIASARHASVNFGQYAYASYPPNRPTLCRKFIPMEGTKEFAKFLKDPDRYYLSMLPERSVTTLSVAMLEILSRHTSDEMYLGQMPMDWTDNEEIQQKFKEFRDKLQEIEKSICERNRNPQLKNRRGPAKIPFEILRPHTSNDNSEGGITGKGIPNSISI